MEEKALATEQGYTQIKKVMPGYPCCFATSWNLLLLFAARSSCLRAHFPGPGLPGPFRDGATRRRPRLDGAAWNQISLPPGVARVRGDDRDPPAKDGADAGPG